VHNVALRVGHLWRQRCHPMVDAVQVEQAGTVVPAAANVSRHRDSSTPQGRGWSSSRQTLKAILAVLAAFQLIVKFYPLMMTLCRAK
jgi:hypothetical protein